MHPPDRAPCSDRARSALFRVTARGYFVNALPGCLSKDARSLSRLRSSFRFHGFILQLDQQHSFVARYVGNKRRHRIVRGPRPCVGSRVVCALYARQAEGDRRGRSCSRLSNCVLPARETSPGKGSELQGKSRQVCLARAEKWVSIRSAGIEENSVVPRKRR